MHRTASSRPPISIIVPFAGDPDEAEALIDAIRVIRTEPADELLVVDNSPTPVLERPSLPGISILRATRKASSYHARNVGAGAAQGEWLLFLDADTRPSPDILSMYFEPAPAAGDGIVAGEVVNEPGQAELAARHLGARGHLRVGPLLRKAPFPTGVTANLLVRRRTWEALGGFHEVRSGGDFEFCWRAQRAGWSLAYRPGAVVAHVHPVSVKGALRKAARYGPGQSWLNRRYPGSSPAPNLARESIRSIGGAFVWALRGDLESARFKVLDGLWAWAFAFGYFLGDNRPATKRREPGPGHHARCSLLLASTVGDQAQGSAVHPRLAPGAAAAPLAIVARSRPEVPNQELLDGLEIGPATRLRFVEDISGAQRIRALAALAVRHPFRASRAARVLRSAPGAPASRSARLSLLGAVVAGIAELAPDAAGHEAVDWPVGDLLGSILGRGGSA
jgi:GT2 family glycosyltransferase